MVNKYCQTILFEVLPMLTNLKILQAKKKMTKKSRNVES